MAAQCHSSTGNFAIEGERIKKKKKGSSESSLAPEE
jgi:hypothetical protein